MRTIIVAAVLGLSAIPAQAGCIGWPGQCDNETDQEYAQRREREREYEGKRHRFEAWCWESSLFRMLNSDCPYQTKGGYRK
jgi:hypothetical protein